MRWVDQAMTRPFRCAVVPYIGNGSGHSFVDTGQDLDLEHVYVSDVGCEQLAQAIGWVPPQVLQEAERRVQEANGRVAELEAELSEHEQFRESVDGLTRAGMVVRKQPGRKKKETANGVG